MDADLLAIITEDCYTLLRRAFEKQIFTMFGEDGFGKHGRNDMFISVECIGILVTLKEKNDGGKDVNDLVGRVDLVMNGYDSQLYGYAITDKNLRASIDRHLDAVGIDQNIVDWEDLGAQGRFYISLRFDPAGLLLH